MQAVKMPNQLQWIGMPVLNTVVVQVDSLESRLYKIISNQQLLKELEVRDPLVLATVSFFFLHFKIPLIDRPTFSPSSLISKRGTLANAHDTLDYLAFGELPPAS
jgi:hypothetical protein